MKIKAGNVKENLVKAAWSALIYFGAPSAAPIYMTPKTRGIKNAAITLLN